MKKFNSHIGAYVVVTVLFFILVLVLPANKLALQEYSLTSTQYHVLLFSLELPLAAIWFAAFYGSSLLRRYAASITKTSEGAGYAYLARGCKWLAWGLAIPSVVSLILSTIANDHPGFYSPTVIIVNYLSLLFPLVAYTFIGTGAHSLLGDRRIRSIFGLRILLFVFALLSVLYCYFTFSHLAPHSLTSRDNPYLLPAWLQILSISLPYLYIWFTGLLASYDISLFARNIRGVLYRRPLELVAGGIGVVIASSIIVQYVRAVLPRAASHLSLNATLVAVYIIYALMALGFVLIGLGAYRLKKIEEV